MVTQIPFINELSQVMEGLKGHEQRSLRPISVLPILVESVLNFADLSMHSDRIFRQKHLISINALVFIDTLRFFTLLTLLIANGITVNKIFREFRLLVIYTSGP